MSLPRTSVVVVVTHAIAAAWAAAFLREGMPGVRGREQYVADHAQSWITGWLLFALAGIALVYWMILARDRLARDRAATGMTLAVLLTAIGLALECAGHALACALPSVAQYGHDGSFAAVERAGQMLALVFGQLFFGCGVLVAASTLSRARAAGEAAAAAGLANFAAAMATMGTTLAGSVHAAPYVTGAVLVSLFVFILAAGRSRWATTGAAVDGDEADGP